MKIYQTSSKNKFLDEVADFVIKEFKGKMHKQKIIMPNGLACSSLQRLIVKKLGICILPKIMPFGGIALENEEIFKLPSEKTGAISKLEEKLFLAQLIYEYEHLEYNFIQSLSLAPSIASLLYEMEANDIDIIKLKNLPLLDKAEHWHKIYELIHYIHNNWYNKLKELNKISRLAYQKLIFDNELKRLQDRPDQIILLAGIIGSNSLTNNFIKDLIALDKCYIITAPGYNYITSTKDYKPEEALYKMQQLAKILGSKITKLGNTSSTTSTLDNLITNVNGANVLNTSIKYAELNNIFHEAEYIAIKAKKLLDSKPNAQIAIIAHTQSAKEQYCTFLDKYSLKYKDQFGDNILNNPAVTLLLLTSKILCSEFSIKEFFALLSHPLVISEETIRIQNLIRKYNKHAANIDDISAIVNKHADDITIEKYTLLKDVLLSSVTSNKFNHIFTKSLKSAEIVASNIWQQFPEISESINEIKQLNYKLTIKNIYDFTDILKQMLSGGRTFNNNKDSNILICRSNAASLVNFDLVIITDLNENNYPSSISSSPILTLKMQIDLGLENKVAELGSNLYDFYLNLCNENVLLTRSKKQNGKQTLASPFILKLKHILKDNLQCLIAKPEEYKSIKHIDAEFSNSNFFPNTLYVTDIETLIRSPYNFYAKKILNLRKIEEIDEKPSLAVFGNFFHETVEKYTNQYNAKEKNKEAKLTELALGVLNNISAPDSYKESWLIKIKAIAKEFIEFDEKRRDNSTHIHTEIEGSAVLNINGNDVQIKAIADRIEVDKQGCAHIMDFKTGAIPLKSEVLSGLSPQLIVEAIILQERGFNIKPCAPASLVYIKINSSKPYIKITEIKLTEEQIQQHKKGLEDLLNHYAKTLNFSIKQNKMKYDDYSHLARR